MTKLLLLAAMTLVLAMGAFAGKGTDSEQHGAKVTVVLTHEVKEYDAWRKLYDADAPNRAKGGFKVSGVYRDAKSPNVVTIIGEFPNAAAVDGFLSNPKLKEVMEKAGVIGAPEVKVLTKAGS